MYKFSKSKVDTQFRCPVYKCLTKFSNQSQLKSHISRKHKELEDAGIEVQNNGKIKYPLNLIDNVIRVLIWQKKFVNQVVRKDLDRKVKELERADQSQQMLPNGNPYGF